MTVAGIYHPKRKQYHAVLACVVARTRATEDTLRVLTETQLQADRRRPCPDCWAPGGYVVQRESIGFSVHLIGSAYG